MWVLKWSVWKCFSSQCVTGQFKKKQALYRFLLKLRRAVGNFLNKCTPNEEFTHVCITLYMWLNMSAAQWMWVCWHQSSFIRYTCIWNTATCIHWPYSAGKMKARLKLELRNHVKKRSVSNITIPCKTFSRSCAKRTWRLIFLKLQMV